ncbi:UNVERIFIED_CONTAM: hypothetical protein Cloal_0433 [Acetivibrio alkalicellulosi]
MEYLGVMAFVLVMFHMGLPDDVKRLKKQIKRIISKRKKGVDFVMSSIIKELEGKRCKITLYDNIEEITCNVLQVDEQWIKAIKVDRQGKESTVILRIEDIERVKIIE